jgi:hypothetical protein
MQCTNKSCILIVSRTVEEFSKTPKSIGAKRRVLSLAISMRQKKIPWSKIKAETGCHPEAVKRAKIHHDRGEPMIGKSGRPKVISDEGFLELVRRVRLRTEANTSRKKSVFMEIVLDIIRQEQRGKGVSPDDPKFGKISDSKMNELWARFKRVRGEKKKDNRVVETYDIRNYLSFLVILYCVYFPDFQQAWSIKDNRLPVMPAYNVWNMDSTQVVLSDDKVTFEKEAIVPGDDSWRRQRRQSHGHKSRESVSSYLRIRYCCYTNAAGDLGTPVFKISGHNKPGAGGEVKQIKLERFVDNRYPAYVYVVPKSVKDEDFYNLLFERHVLEDMRETEERNRGGTIWPAGTTENQKRRKLLVVDGEGPQVKSLICLKPLLRNISCEWLKPAASCTSTQQPNDVASCFRTMKQHLKGLVYKLRSNFNSDDIPSYYKDKPYMKALNDGLKEFTTLEKPQRMMVLKFLYEGPEVLNFSFRRASIQAGYANSGVYPFNAPKILGNCSGWIGMLPSQHKRLFEVATVLCEKTRRRDRVKEEDMDQLKVPGGTMSLEEELRARNDPAHVFYDPFGFERQIARRPVNQRPDNEQRTIWMNCETEVEEREKEFRAAEALRLQREEVERLRREQAAAEARRRDEIAAEQRRLQIEQQQQQQRIAQQRLAEEAQRKRMREEAAEVELRGLHAAKKLCEERGRQLARVSQVLVVRDLFCQFCNTKCNAGGSNGWSQCERGSCQAWYCARCTSKGFMEMHEEVCKGVSWCAPLQEILKISHN